MLTRNLLPMTVSNTLLEQSISRKGKDMLHRYFTLMSIIKRKNYLLHRLYGPSVIP